MPVPVPPRPRRSLRASYRLVLPGLALGLVALVPVPAQAATATPAAATTLGAVATPVAATSSRPVLRYGSTGSYVKRVQTVLRVSPASGWFGPLTRSAVVRFQKASRLPATGVVEARTWRALDALAARQARAPRSPGAVVAGTRCPAPGARLISGWGAARGGGMHKGVDLAGRRGSPILAVEAGSILRAGATGSGQLRIVLQGRSGAKYYYGHNDRHYVRAGQRVVAGQRIAAMGDTGGAGVVHLHFEWWRSGGESAAVPAEPLIRQLCR